MENQFQINEESLKKMEQSHRRGKIMGGLLVITAGVLFLAKELGADIPTWVFSWKMLLIALGLISAVKHKFRHPGWLIFMLIGGVFLVGDLYPEIQIKPFLWPALLILAGLFIVFKPRRKHKHHHCHGRWQRRRGGFHEHYSQDPAFAGDPSAEDFIESVTFMAGVKKNMISKKFKGGDITNVFGGTELNLMQTDFEGKAKLEITQVFGATELIIPSNWEIRSELVTVFGNLDDKRPVVPVIGGETEKILMLTGTTVFGGIEISSY